MRISDETLLSLTSGQIRMVQPGDGYVSFRRFSEAQEARISVNFGKRPAASSGMFIELEGDVKRIAFDYRVEMVSSRPFFGFSVLENGVKQGGFVRRAEFEEGTFSYEPTAPGRLTIYLPNLHVTSLRNVEIEGAFRPVARRRKLFIAGDSITMGFDAEHPERCFSNRLTEAMFASPLNQAIGGDEFRKTNLEDLPDFTPDVVAVNYGTNDWARQRDVRVTADAYLQKLAECFPGARRFVILPIWRTSEGTVKEKTGWTIQDVREIIAEAALRYGCTVIPGIDLIPHDPAMFSDGKVHPTDTGFDYYSENLIRAFHEIAPDLITNERDEEE